MTTAAQNKQISLDAANTIIKDVVQQLLYDLEDMTVKDMEEKKLEKLVTKAVDTALDGLDWTAFLKGLGTLVVPEDIFANSL